MTTTRYTIADIKAANKAAGQHFFAPKTMRFFASKVEAHVYSGPGGVFFVTSEQFTPSSGRPEHRTYKVREFNPQNGHVWGVGAALANLQDARDVASQAAKSEATDGE